MYIVFTAFVQTVIVGTEGKIRVRQRDCGRADKGIFRGREPRGVGNSVRVLMFAGIRRRGSELVFSKKRSTMFITLFFVEQINKENLLVASVNITQIRQLTCPARRQQQQLHGTGKKVPDN
jgi:hypothetical protein